MGEGPVNRALREGRARTSEFTARVPELRERVPELRERGAELARQYARMDVRWARCAPVRALREALMNFGLGPLIDLYTKPRVEGREIFDDLVPPVILVANHSSHLDTPTILRAMPLKWRQRTAVAAAADYFYKSRLTAYGVAVLLNTVPLARKGGGLSNGATDHVDRLIHQRWNLLMFPEGTRSRNGDIGKLRSGAAVLAAQHGIPIVPIHVTGTHAAMPPGRNWPKRRPGRILSRRHPVRVRFGAPIWPGPNEHRTEVMARVRAFFEGDEEAARRPRTPVPARVLVPEATAAVASEQPAQPLAPEPAVAASVARQPFAPAAPASAISAVKAQPPREPAARP
jgi:1-acyl-sn-glycerol-3-phosphate acyltransferase